MEITIINQDKTILLILKIFTKIVTIIEIIMKKVTKNKQCCYRIIKEHNRSILLVIHFRSSGVFSTL